MFSINEIEEDLILLDKPSRIEMDKVIWINCSDKLVYECRENQNVDLSFRILPKNKQMLSNNLEYLYNHTNSKNGKELYSMYLSCINEWNSNIIADVYIEQDGINVPDSQEPALIFTFRDSIKGWGYHNSFEYCKEANFVFMRNMLFRKLEKNGRCDGDDVLNKLYSVSEKFHLYQVGFFRRDGKDYLKCYLRFVPCDKICEGVSEVFGDRAHMFFNYLQDEMLKYSQLCVLDFTWDLNEMKHLDKIGVSYDAIDTGEIRWNDEKRKKINGIDVFLEKRYISHYKVNIGGNGEREYKKYYEHLKRNMFYKNEEYLMH